MKKVEGIILWNVKTNYEAVECAEIDRQVETMENPEHVDARLEPWRMQHCKPVEEK